MKIQTKIILGVVAVYAGYVYYQFATKRRIASRQECTSTDNGKTFTCKPIPIR